MHYMHLSHFSIMSPGHSQPQSTLQLPVYVNLFLTGTGFPSAPGVGVHDVILPQLLFFPVLKRAI